MRSNNYDCINWHYHAQNSLTLSKESVDPDSVMPLKEGFIFFTKTIDMKNVRLFYLFCFALLFVAVSCQKETALDTLESTISPSQENVEIQQLSTADLQKIEGLYATLARQERLIELQPEEIQALVTNYFTQAGAFDIQVKPSANSEINPRIVEYVTENIAHAINGDQVNEEALAQLKNKILQLEEISLDWKTAFLSSIQLNRHLATSISYKQYREKVSLVENRADCDCSGIYATWVNADIQCQYYSQVFPWLAPAQCAYANSLYSSYLDCLNTNPCPPGSVYDGANCYFGIHAPSGSNPFIWNGGFYWQAGPGNSCCCGSWYDGANCYAGHGGAGAFVWNNSFYVTPRCEVQ